MPGQLMISKLVARTLSRAVAIAMLGVLVATLFASSLVGARMALSGELAVTSSMPCHGSESPAAKHDPAAHTSLPGRDGPILASDDCCGTLCHLVALTPVMEPVRPRDTERPGPQANVRPPESHEPGQIPRPPNATV